MNENSPRTLSVKDWLDDATRQLVFADIPTARLDAELILSHTLRETRAHLHAHEDDELSSRDIEIAGARLDLRLDRVPVAYIIGHKEFYGRRFKVTTGTLIPRPESETLIELIDEVIPKNLSLVSETPLKLVDIGTGSGILGITVKLAHPELDVTLTDISKHALKIAEHNARAHHAKVQTLQGDLLAAYPFVADIVVANLPYVDAGWERSEETRHEPAEALFADNGGKALIFKLLAQTKTKLKNGGWLILEADPEQHNAIIEEAKKYGLLLQDRRDYGVSLHKLG